MSVLMVLDWPGTPLEVYRRVNEIMGINGDTDAPDGLVEHVAAEDERGMVICDVWESEEQLAHMAETRLRPAFAEAGLTETPPRVMPVHNRIVGGGGADPAVLVLVEISGYGSNDYDEMTSRMDAHVLNDHPAVAHTAAVSDGGLCVADLWDSAESFGRFAEEQIGPAAQQMGMTDFRPRILAVRNRIRGRVPQSQ